MPLTLTSFFDGTAVSADQIRNRISLIEGYLNGNIDPTDLQVTPAWVDYTLIYGLDFFGSPAPRVEGISADTHYRFADDDWLKAAIFHADDAGGVDQYFPIRGLAATVRTSSESSLDQAVVDVMCNFWIYTILGSDLAGLVLEGTVIGEVAMFSGTTKLNGTVRTIYAQPTSATDILGRKNISMIAQFAIPAGTRNIWVGLQMEADPMTPNSAAQDEPEWKHIFVDVRSMVVNVHALHA